MSKTILLVTTGESRKAYILERIKALGYHLVILESEINWAQAYADDWILADTSSFPTCLQAVEDYPQTVDGIVTFDEFGVELAAALVTHLQLPGISRSVASECRHKDRFRAFCRQNQLPTADFKLIATPQDFAQAQTQFAHRQIVLKPTSGFLSENVQIFASAKEINWEQHQGFLIEEKLEGQEIDADVLVQNGQLLFIGISDNTNRPEPYCLQASGNMPSQLSNTDLVRVKNTVTQLITALEIVDGCLHIEAMVNSRGVYIIEANLRMGGAENWVFNKVTYGVDLVQQSLNLALNQVVELPKLTINKSLIAHTFLPEISGTITQLEVDLPALKATPCVEEIILPLELEQTILAPPDGFRALGYIVVSGTTMQEAEANLQAILPSIKYTITPN